MTQNGSEKLTIITGAQKIQVQIQELAQESLGNSNHNRGGKKKYEQNIQYMRKEARTCI